MAMTEEERRWMETLAQATETLAGLSAETRRLTAEEKAAAEAAAKFQARMGAVGSAAAALANTFVAYNKAIYDGESANKAASAGLGQFAETVKYASAAIALFMPGGILIKGAVAGLGLLASKLVETSKLVADQTDDIYKAYREMAQAGASGAGAMQDAFDGIQKVGLGTQKFAVTLKLLNESAGDIAQFGTTMNRGRKIFEDTMGSLSREQRVQMEQMGLDREAQAEATMGYIKQQRLLVRGTQDQMDTSSASVMRYIKETDTLTRITGQNRKEQEKLMEDALRNESFNATLQQIREEQGEDAAKQVQAALIMARKAGPETAKQFQDSLSGFVGATDEAGKAYLATNGKMQEFTEKLRTGQLKDTKQTAEAMGTVMEAYGDTAREFRGQAQMMNYGKTFGSFEEALNAGKIGVDGLAKAFKDAEDERAKQLADANTKLAAETENTVRDTQLKQQALVNLGMTAYLKANKTAADANYALATAALEAAKELGKLGVGADASHEQIQQQDDANWKSATLGEKVQSSFARGVEKAGRGMGVALGFVNDAAGKFVTDMANNAQRARVESESQYLQQQGRYKQTAPGAPGAGGAAGGGSAGGGSAGAAPASTPPPAAPAGGGAAAPAPAAPPPAAKTSAPARPSAAPSGGSAAPASTPSGGAGGSAAPSAPAGGGSPAPGAPSAPPPAAPTGGARVGRAGQAAAPGAASSSAPPPAGGKFIPTDPLEIMNFQQSAGIKVDGRMGKQTIEAMKKAGYREHDVPGNLKAIVGDLRNMGGTFADPEYLKALVGNVMKESGGMGVNENMVGYKNTPNDRIRLIFGSRITDAFGPYPTGATEQEQRQREAHDAKLDEFKKKDANQFAYEFTELVYGHTTELGRRMGNTQPGDGAKYRGRGFIGITGKNNYAAASQYLYKDNSLVQDPEKLNDVKTMVPAVGAYLKAISNPDRMRPTLGIPPGPLSREDAEVLVTSQIAGSDIRKKRKAWADEILGKVAKFSNQYSETAMAANGGVFSGPKSGYPITMHGTEAVVPLPDGKKIPVSLDIKQDRMAEGGVGPTVGGFNPYLGYNMGPMRTDLTVVKQLAATMGAFDKATQTITNPEAWKEIVKSGIATNYEIGMAKIGTEMLPNIGQEMAQRLTDIVSEKGVDQMAAFKQMTAEFKSAMTDALSKLTESQGNGDVKNLLGELVSRQREANDISSKLLSYAQN